MKQTEPCHDDVYDAIHGSHSTAEKSSAVGDCAEKTNGLPLFNNARDINLLNVHAVCNDCARSLGFTRKNKAVGVRMGECGVCHQRKPCTDLWHDCEPAKKGEAK